MRLCRFSKAWQQFMFPTSHSLNCRVRMARSDQGLDAFVLHKRGLWIRRLSFTVGGHMRGLPQFVHPHFLHVRLLQHKYPFVKCHLFKPEAQSCCQLMSAFCQVNLARQQNINCLQLAEFPPFSCSRGQSGARSVEQRRLAVATAPLPLVYTLHTLLTAFVRLLKLPAKVKHK